MNEATTELRSARDEVGVQKPPPTAEKAASYFRLVSSKFSASGFAQAARIAQLCRNSNYDPLELRNKLWDDKPQRKDLIADAIEAHKLIIKKAEERGVPEDKLPKPPERAFVKRLMLRNIVYEFTLASQMMNLPEQEIDWILSQYENYRGKEDKYGDAVSNRMQELIGVTPIGREEAAAMVTQHRIEGVKNWARNLHKPTGNHAASNNLQTTTSTVES